MIHQGLGKRLSALLVCCGFLRTLTLDASLDSVHAAPKQTLIFVCGWRVCFDVFRHTEIRCTVQT